MAAIHLLLQIILKAYISNASWNNCILQISSTAQKTLIKNYENISSYYLTNSSLFSQIPERCECFIIWDIENKSSNFTETILQSIDDQLLYGNISFRYNNRIIIVVTDRNGNSMDHIISTKSLHFVMHFLLLLWDGRNINPNETDSKNLFLHKFVPAIYKNCSEINLFTHKYVGLNGEQPVLLDTFESCTNTFKNDAVLFPDKLSNQHGRPLRIHSSEVIIPRVNISTLYLIVINVCRYISKVWYFSNKIWFVDENYNGIRKKT